MRRIHQCGKFRGDSGGGGRSRTWGQLCDHPCPHPPRLLT
ncbi:RIKEN cDNA A730085E03 [Mus musculus]|nr:RIKEN cDNA A730085E03 [Mus musculus]